jgi:hypothetical protein
MADPAAEEWIPNWRDAHGVVHIMGSHTATRAFTECGIVVVSRDDGRSWENYYEANRDAPTCIACIARDAEGDTAANVVSDFLRQQMDRPPSLMSQLIKPVDADE